MSNVFSFRFLRITTGNRKNCVYNPLLHFSLNLLLRKYCAKGNGNGVRR
jgi:hypothetical protein